MKTATQTRKTLRTAKKVTRTCNVGSEVNGTRAMHLTITNGNKTEHFGYYATKLASDFGTAYRLEKFGAEQVEGEPSVYDVNIDPHGFSSCECLGFARWNHCKHLESLTALTNAGRI
jgi:hypothetical protein